MARELYADRPVTPATLSAGIDNAQTTITPSSLTPYPASGNFTLLIDVEIVLCTAVNAGAGTLTIARGQEGTTAVSHLAGAPVLVVLTAASLQRLAIVSKNGTPVAARRELNLIEGSGTSLTVADNAGADRVDATFNSTGGGGGGGGVVVGTAASRPSPGVAGARQGYLPTDANTLWTSDGTLWYPRGPVFPLVDPPQAGWTQINFGGSTTTSARPGRVTLRDTNAPGGDAVRAMVMAAPATPYSITASFLFSLSPMTTSEGGLLWRESATGKLHSLCYRNDNQSIHGYQWDSPTAFHGDAMNPGAGTDLELIRFLRIADDGTFLRIFSSSDGIDFIPLPIPTSSMTYGRTGYMTGGPDQVGFFLNCLTSGCAGQVSLISWIQA